MSACFPLILMLYPNRPRMRVHRCLLASLLLLLLLVSCGGAGEWQEQAADFEVTLFEGGSFRLSD